MLQRRPSKRSDVLLFMGSMAVVSGNWRVAEGYLNELLSWCTFAARIPGMQHDVKVESDT